MNILGNPFVKKAIKSMLTPEQYQIMENFTTAVQNGKIDMNVVKSLGDKLAKKTPEEVNSFLKMMDENLK